jgi:23S rRNA (pseudouridine1915-N3)-methyltransferase
MNGTILCVGRLREKWQREGCAEYLKRLSRYGKYEVIEVDDLPAPERASEAQIRQVMEKEGQALLKHIRPGDRVIALTIGGREMDSEALAAHIRDLRTGGAGRIVFVIGGSLGLGRNVLERADEELSMGRMTFPHQLARVMLLEQLYRAEKINTGERYHK